MKPKIEISKISLRPATEADSEFAYQVLKTALGSYIAMTFNSSEQQQRELNRRRLRPSDTSIIKFDDKEIGLIAVNRETDQIRVRQLFILPDFQRYGIGAHLMQDILLEVKLQVFKVNNPAKAFFEKLGFSVIGDTETHFQLEYGRQ
jgi:N-acetylglutamate synthase-like GNAT family acetyltransferase